MPFASRSPHPAAPGCPACVLPRERAGPRRRGTCAPPPASSCRACGLPAPALPPRRAPLPLLSRRRRAAGEGRAACTISHSCRESAVAPAEEARRGRGREAECALPAEAAQDARAPPVHDRSRARPPERSAAARRDRDVPRALVRGREAASADREIFSPATADEGMPPALILPNARCKLDRAAPTGLIMSVFAAAVSRTVPDAHTLLLRVWNSRAACTSVLKQGGGPHAQI